MAATPSGRPRTVRRFEIAAAVVLALVLLAMLWDWNWLRGPIERRVSAATGRSFDIAGDLDVDLGLHPRVDVGRMVLGNVPGAKEPRMASVDHLTFRIDLLRWLRGRLVLSQVRVAHPDLLLEKDAKGRANWVFPAGEAEWPTIRQLDVSDGRVRYRNPRRRTDLDFEVRSGAPVKDARVAPLLLQGKGRYAGEPVSVEGKVESPLALKDPAKPYHIDLRARAGAGAQVDVVRLGRVLERERRFDLAFHADRLAGVTALALEQQRRDPRVLHRGAAAHLEVQVGASPGIAVAHASIADIELADRRPLRLAGGEHPVGATLRILFEQQVGVRHPNLREHQPPAQPAQQVDAERQMIHAGHARFLRAGDVAEHHAPHVHARVQAQVHVQVTGDVEAAPGGGADAALDRAAQPVPVPQHGQQYEGEHHGRGDLETPYRPRPA